MIPFEKALPGGVGAGVGVDLKSGNRVGGMHKVSVLHMHSGTSGTKKVLIFIDREESLGESFPDLPFIGGIGNVVATGSSAHFVVGGDRELRLHRQEPELHAVSHGLTEPPSCGVMICVFPCSTLLSQEMLRYRCKLNRYGEFRGKSSPQVLMIACAQGKMTRIRGA